MTEAAKAVEAAADATAGKPHDSASDRKRSLLRCCSSARPCNYIPHAPAARSFLPDWLDPAYHSLPALHPAAPAHRSALELLVENSLRSRPRTTRHHLFVTSPWHLHWRRSVRLESRDESGFSVSAAGDLGSAASNTDPRCLPGCQPTWDRGSPSIGVLRYRAQWLPRSLILCVFIGL